MRGSQLREDGKKARSTNPIIYNTGSDIVLLSVETLANQDMHMAQVLN
jgi:hypothetical protein